jgi:hypothetical protein
MYISKYFENFHALKISTKYIPYVFKGELLKKTQEKSKVVSLNQKSEKVLTTVPGVLDLIIYQIPVGICRTRTPSLSQICLKPMNTKIYMIIG